MSSFLSKVVRTRYVEQQSSKRVRGRLAGASILCFMVDPTYRGVYFLLGKERHNSRWPSGSGKWSDFGGSVDAVGDSAEETAAREFVEETLAVVKYFDGDTIPRESHHDIATDLSKGNYHMKLSQSDDKRRFVVFVKQIPWDPVAVSRFSDFRAALTRPVECGQGKPVFHHPACNTSGYIPKQYLEKKSLGIWSLAQLQYAVGHGAVLKHRAHHDERCRESFLASVELILRKFT